MTTAVQDGREFLDINGTRLETLDTGNGPTVLFLHGGFWLADENAFTLELSRHARVIAPMHPGFGASDDPGDIASTDDLAYLYLDLIDQLGLQNVVLAGASFGGWIAAEMATKNCNKLSGLVLLGALGIRPGGRSDRIITDIFGTRDSELARRIYKKPPADADNLRSINDDDELRRRLRARDGLAYFGWQPYMHNPRLQSRLHRIKTPTLVLWGDSDGIVTPDYGRTFADGVPDSKFELIKDAGHMAHVEHPEAVSKRIAAFAHSVTKDAAMPA